MPEPSHPVRALPVLGILGGMGPLATVDFFGKVVACTPARCDQEHMPIIIRNVPQVPDRSDAFFAGSDEPWPSLLAGLRMLELAGVQAIAIPCNTAHLWHSRLASATSIPVLHIGRCAAQWLTTTHPRFRSVGLLATPATVQARIYHREFERVDVALIDPSAEEQATWVTAGIHAVKAGNIALGRELLMKAARKLLARRPAPQALVLGCTEVPIALAGQDLGTPIVDSSEILARACVQWWQCARRLTGQAKTSSLVQSQAPRDDTEGSQCFNSRTGSTAEASGTVGDA